MKRDWENDFGLFLGLLPLIIVIVALAVYAVQILLAK